MIKHYFKQALAQLRQYPLISVISIASDQQIHLAAGGAVGACGPDLPDLPAAVLFVVLG